MAAFIWVSSPGSGPAVILRLIRALSKRGAGSHGRYGAPGSAADGEVERHRGAHQQVAGKLRAQAARVALELQQLTVLHGVLLWVVDGATLGQDNPFVKRIVLIRTILDLYRLGVRGWPAPT